MDQATKGQAIVHFQSIATLAVQAQDAIRNNDFTEVRDILDSIAHDVNRIETIGKEALEAE